MKTNERPFDQPPDRKKPKLPYQAPRLTKYGHVAKLTAGGSGQSPEGMSGMIGMM